MSSAPVFDPAEVEMPEKGAAYVTSFGSRYWVFPRDRALADRLAQCNLERGFGRVTLDPATGLVLLMSPTFSHENHAAAVRDVVPMILDALNVKHVKLESTRLRHPEDKKNTGTEADAAYYLGDLAEWFLEIGPQGPTQANEFILRNAPQLVVEVGETHVDDEKVCLYRDRGVQELWSLDNVAPQGSPVVLKARFRNCIDEGGVTKIPTSRLLPDITPEILVALVEAAQWHGHEWERKSAIEGVLETYQISSVAQRPK